MSMIDHSPKQRVSAVLLHDLDNVICLLRDHVVGDKPVLFTDESGFTEGPPLLADVTLGHKVARSNIAKFANVVKYGVPIGVATQPIVAGEHVHLHNLTGLPPQDRIAEHE